MRLGVLLTALCCGWAPQVGAAWTADHAPGETAFVSATWSESHGLGPLPDNPSRMTRPERGLPASGLTGVVTGNRFVAGRSPADLPFRPVSPPSPPPPLGRRPQWVGVVELRL